MDFLNLQKVVDNRTLTLACGLLCFKATQYSDRPFPRMSAHLWVRTWCTAGWPQFVVGSVLWWKHDSSFLIVKSLDLQRLECTFWKWDNYPVSKLFNPKFGRHSPEIVSTRSIRCVQSGDLEALRTMPQAQLLEVVERTYFGGAFRFSALDLACCFNEIESCRVILSRLEDPLLYLRSDPGRTALMWACVGGSADCVKLLLAFGANLALCVGWVSVS